MIARVALKLGSPLLPALLAMTCVGPPAGAPESYAGTPSLRITSPAKLPQATKGGGYFYLMAASGGSPPYNWSSQSSTGNTAWTMTPQGWLEAAPTSEGANSVVITVSDATNQVARGTFSVAVDSNLAVMNQDFARGGVSLPPAVAGNAYSHMLQAAGGSRKHIWRVGSGSLPPGLHLSSNGLISGTPSGTGASRSRFVLEVRDSAGHTATAAATLSVAAPDQVARPSYNRSKGFFVLRGELYDPNGKRFRIRGVNRVHFDNPDQPGMANAHVNTVRFFMYNIGWVGAPPASTYEALSLQQNIDYEELPIVTAANVAGTNRASTGDWSTADLATIVAWWTQNKQAFAPIMNQIAINIANEWGPPKGSADWASAYERAVPALRAAGYTCPLVIDAGGSGQDIEDFSRYASKVLDTDPERNIIFSFHFYGLGKAYPPGSTLPELTAITARLASLERSTGAAFIIGEFGPGHKIGPSPTDLSPGQIIEAAEANGLGWLAWAWDDNDQGGCNSSEYSFSMTRHCGQYLAPSRLTRYGLDVALNPAYGWIALASPAAFFVEEPR